MNMPRLVASAILSAGIVTTVSSQTGLTLEQCLQLAREHSPALRAANDAVQASELSRSELSTGSLPQLKGTLGGSYAPLPPSFGYDPVISNGGEIAGQIILQQSLYDGGMRSVRFDQNRLDHDRLEMERRRVERDLMSGVEQSFVELLRARRETGLQQQSVNQLTAYDGLVQRLFNGGGATYTDVLKTEVQLSNATLALQKAREAELTAQISLAELIGASIDSSVSVMGSLETSERDSMPTGESLTHNVDLTIAGLGIERGLLDVELAKRERLPEISFAGDAGYLSSIENLRLPSSERVSALGYSIGVGIDIPILNWGATGLRIEQRELEVDAQRQQVEILRRSISSDFQKTRLALANARNRLQTVRSNVTKAEDNYLLTRSQYAGGGTSSFEVLAAQQLLTEAKLAELETLASIRVLEAKMVQLTSE
jgi:outer membrane protein TolC